MPRLRSMQALNLFLKAEAKGKGEMEMYFIMKKESPDNSAKAR